MEQSYLAIGALVACVFAITKFIEVKYIVKDDEFPLKNIIRDSLITYVSTIVGLFVMDQVSEKVTALTPTTAFTGSPDF